MACELPDIPYCENCQTKFISKCPKNRKKSVKKLNIRTKTYREPFLKPELRYNFTCPLFEVDYNLYEFLPFLWLIITIFRIAASFSELWSYHLDVEHKSWRADNSFSHVLS